jgi:hypothetical protein
VPWTNLSILPSITSWTRETGKTPLFASESLVKSDGGELSDFATGPSPFPDTPWQEAQDRRNSFRPGFSSGCACRTSIVPIIAEAANMATHHVVRISWHPLRVCPFNSPSRTARAMMTSRRRFMRSALRGSARPPQVLSSIGCMNSHGAVRNKRYHAASMFKYMSDTIMGPVNKSTIGYFKSVMSMLLLVALLRSVNCAPAHRTDQASADLSSLF